MKLNSNECDYIGLCVEGFLFGLYSGIFRIHLQHYARNKGNDNVRHNLTHYALCVLYVLSMAAISLDIALFVVEYEITIMTVLHLSDFQIVVFACCDSIAQFILIYRCWIVWGRNIYVVIIPSVLAFTYLAMWIAQIRSYFIVPGGTTYESSLGDDLALAGLTASMTVNGLVTGLIVLRIFTVFRARSMSTTSEEKSVGITAGGKLRSIIFVIIESAMALFVVQLTRLTMGFISIRSHTSATFAGVYDIIVFIHEMLNGIAPTIILVRVSMGFSFHDKRSLEESISSLRFAADHRNPMPAMRVIDSMDEPGSLNIEPGEGIPIPLGTEDITEERRDEALDIARDSDEIQMVDR